MIQDFKVNWCSVTSPANRATPCIHMYTVYEFTSCHFLEEFKALETQVNAKTFFKMFFGFLFTWQNKQEEATNRKPFIQLPKLLWCCQPTTFLLACSGAYFTLFFSCWTRHENPWKELAISKKINCQSERKICCLWHLCCQDILYLISVGRLKVQNFWNQSTSAKERFI